ncbi:hypothetical protein CJ030_MR7G015197 [Morella rubra]|uniref:Uncharacterized protein n=1 Tax=Morella rubra TaxID=262757 RepID=A0A6A1UX34_9ROSI|nr:hypothetical protein CJ030_MR7G015197 [Morella rubra]
MVISTGGKVIKASIQLLQNNLQAVTGCIRGRRRNDSSRWHKITMARRPIKEKQQEQSTKREEAAGAA